MKKCSKCNIEKELDKFQTYYHSTQKTTRTRGICTECFNEQKVERRKDQKKLKDPDKYYSSQPNYRKCTKCGEWKTSDNYYKQKKSSRAFCNQCYNQQQRNIRQQKLNDNGGNILVRKFPNQYQGETQKQQVFEFLQLLGYIYNNGVWIKPGYKEVLNEKIVFKFENFKP
jgi:hypothetical protein